MTMMMSAARRMKMLSVKEDEDGYAWRALPKQLAGNLSKNLQLQGPCQTKLAGVPTVYDLVSRFVPCVVLRPNGWWLEKQACCCRCIGCHCHGAL